MKKLLCILMILSFPLFGKETLVLSLTPYLDAKKVEALHERFRKYLEFKLNKQVILRTSIDYSHQITLLDENKVDMALMSPNLYYQSIKQGYTFPYLATVKKQDKFGDLYFGYKGIIFSLKKSNIVDFEDLKGKRFGYTDTSSTSGYVCPRAAMKKHGLNPDTDIAHSFLLKKHSKVLGSLLSDSIDAGATYDKIYKDAIVTYGDIFNLIYQTPLLPYEAFVVSKKLDAKLKDTIEKAILEYSDTEARGEMPAGFKKIDPSLYLYLCQEE